VIPDVCRSRSLIVVGRFNGSSLSGYCPASSERSTPTFAVRKGMNVFRYGIIEGRLNLRVGHWGAINGKNTWKDCDVAVIYGLPYMDQRRAINSLFATPRGPQETAWLQANTHKQQVVNVIMQRHLSTSVVQAINRICCRRALDDQGRCPVSDVYITLPKNWQGDAILGDIQANMPGINVVPWDYAGWSEGLRST
jgi:hypothetical protein